MNANEKKIFPKFAQIKRKEIAKKIAALAAIYLILFEMWI
jgi:hypothetical protein